MRHLVNKLPARRMAELDPEEFYDFTQVRPSARIDEQGQRSLRWPSNEFFYWKGEPHSKDLLLFIGTEPNLKWKTYASNVVDLAADYRTPVVIMLGGLLTAIPHTREPRLSGSSNDSAMRATLAKMGAPSSTYQGPTGIGSILMEGCARQHIPYAGIWGHASHYIQASPNPRVSLALLKSVSQLLSFPMDLESLRLAEVAFVEEMNQAVAKEPQVAAYIQRLEQLYDEAERSQEEIPSPQAMVEELEKFLKRQQEKKDDGETDTQ